MGTANNAIRHRHRMHLVFAQERDDLGKDCPVAAQIDGFRKPSMRRCRRGLWGPHDADCDLGGAALVGAVESDRSDWITAEASLSLFLEPLPWLLAQLHGHNSSSDSPLRQHIASAGTVSHAINLGVLEPHVPAAGAFFCCRLGVARTRRTARREARTRR